MKSPLAAAARKMLLMTRRGGRRMKQFALICSDDPL